MPKIQSTWLDLLSCGIRPSRREECDIFDGWEEIIVDRERSGGMTGGIKAQINRSTCGVGRWFRIDKVLGTDF